MDQMSYLYRSEGFRDFAPGRAKRNVRAKSRTRKCFLVSAGLVTTFVILATAVGVHGYILLARQKHDPDELECFLAYKRCFSGSPEGNDTAQLAYEWKQTKELGTALLKAVMNKPILGPTKYSFHVSYYETGKQLEPTDPPNAAIEPLLQWLTEGKGCRIGSGIRYNRSQGGFTIGITGKYLIYNHVTFQVPPDVIYRRIRKGKGRRFSFSQATFIRRTSRTDKILQDTTMVPCPHYRYNGGRPSPCHVTTQAAIIRLEANDVLTLKVSPIEYVVGDLESTYFGSMLMEPD